MYEIISTCKGGGYIYCRTFPLHTKRNSKGLYPLHRVLMEKKLNRSLLLGEIVHHKDEDKYNNDIDNLELLTNAEHTKLHKSTVSSIQLICAYCGGSFELKPSIVRRKKKINKNGIYCSRSCSVKNQHLLKHNS